MDKPTVNNISQGMNGDMTLKDVERLESKVDKLAALVEQLTEVAQILVEPEPVADTRPIRIVFATCPDRPDLRFIEVEDEGGKSIRIGRWVDDGQYRVLELEAKTEQGSGRQAGG